MFTIKGRRKITYGSLTQEEMEMMLAEREAVLNGRPIAPLSPDPNNGEALTPAHLLIEEGLRSLALESVGDRAQIMEALATTLRTQANVLAGLVSRLCPVSRSQNQVVHRIAQPETKSGRDHQRGQLPALTLADRESRQGNRRKRRQGQSSRGHHVQQRL